MTPPQKKPGRPGKPDPGSSVSVWVRTPQHDQLASLARARGESISALVRQILTRALPRRPG
jgi:hypothetical protein